MMLSIIIHVPPIKIPIRDIKEVKLIPKKSSEKHYLVEITFLKKKDKKGKITLKLKDYINAYNIKRESTITILSNNNYTSSAIPNTLN